MRALAGEELRRYSVAGRRRLLGLELRVFDGGGPSESAADGSGRTLTLFTWSVYGFAASDVNHFQHVGIFFSLLASSGSCKP